MKSVVSALSVGVTLFSLALAAAACNKAPAAKTAQTVPAGRQAVSISKEPATPEATPADSPSPEGARAGESDATASTADDVETIEGYYVGMFVAEEMDEKKHPMASNRINVSIDSTDGDKVTGHSVIAGTSTPFTGTMEGKGKGVFDMKLIEDNVKDSGVFTAVYNSGTRTISGTWVANDRKAAVTKRSYELVKTPFRYDPKRELGETWATLYQQSDPDVEERVESITDAAGKLNASVKLLKSKDVENMYKRDLEVMRNAIYARHGYTFRNRQMRYFFDNFVDWYVPVKTDVTAELTNVEKQNIALLKRYEQHADKYYDSYGR